MSKGKNRDWGYASYDEDNDTLIYTSYEKDGSVNRYTDNGDGGHSHERWENEDDYNSGNDPDWARYESNSHSNPDTGEIQETGGCYLTTACMKYYSSNFNDNCYELKVLRWFRDNLVFEKDISHYYEIAPKIVNCINNLSEKDLVYAYIYDNIIDYCVHQIEKGNYKEAYVRYKESIISLEENFVNYKKILKENN